MSQTDTIELRGFEEGEKVNSKKKSSAQKSQKKKQQLQQQKEQQHAEHKEQHQKADAGDEARDKKKTSPLQKDLSGVTTNNSNEQRAGEKDAGGGDGPHIGPGVNDDTSFNLEDIFKCDSIPGISGLLSVSFFLLFKLFRRFH